MEPKTLDDIIRIIAKEQDLKIPQVEHIIDSQFRFINNIIESGEDKIISLIHLGKFAPNGIKQAKAKGIYKRGKFINNKTSDDSSRLLQLLNERKQRYRENGNEENESLS